MMKILLVGEYSALHKNLKAGLKKIGVDVSLAANGDGWKRIDGLDFPLFAGSDKFLGKIYRHYIQAFCNANKFKGYDVVQFINPILYSPFVNYPIMRKIIHENNVISMVSAGYDYSVYNIHKKGVFEYYALDYIELPTYDEKTLRGKINIYGEKRIIKYADIIIPNHYEYAIGYGNDFPLYKVLPFPINIDEIEYKENKVNDKLVFFHGLNRELEKGTSFIRQALKKLKIKYPDDVEIIIDGHIPYKQYLELIKRANIVVDQCCSYGYGMNACIAMAQGKVVISGCRKESLDALGVSQSPIIEARPDVDFLFKQMEYIVQNRNQISQWGYESRKYIEELHDYKKVAQQYIEAWKSTGKI